MGASTATGDLNRNNHNLERFLHCDASCRQAIAAGQWEQALSSQQQCFDLMINAKGGERLSMPERLALLMNRLLGELHQVMSAAEEATISAERQAELLWRTHGLLEQRRQLPIELPAWLPVVEEALERKAALCWQDRIERDPRAPARALELFNRLGEILDPCPLWVDRSRQELQIVLAGQPARSLLVGLGFEADQPRLVEHSGDRIVLNLASCRLAPDKPAGLEATLSQALQQIQKDHGAACLVLEDGRVSLMNSWGARLLLGERCPLAEVQLGARAAELWRRLAAAAGLELAPAILVPAAELQEQPLALQLDAMELAILGLAQQPREELGQALEQLGQHRQDMTFWRQGQGERQWWLDDPDPVALLRRFARDLGFYGNAAEPLRSLEAWLEAAWCALTPVVLWGEGVLWSEEEASEWLYLPVFEALARGCGLPPLLRAAPELEQLHGRLAGEELLVVGPAMPEIELQHQSGQALDLYEDLELQPYGLRSVALPESRHPLRPHRSFEESLEHCLAAIERQQQQRSFTLAVLGPGVYRLPLCHELRSRYGLPCLALGSNLPQLFGVDVPGQTPLRPNRRRRENWRRADQV